MSAVSVVIPSWNGKNLLTSICLPSLAAQTFRNFSIVVVDNGSTDGTVSALRSSWPDVEVIGLRANRGFAGAVNRGISQARSQLIVLLNNDVELDPGWMQEMVAAAEQFPTAGSFACKMLDFADRTLISTVGDCVSDGGSFFWRGHRERDAGQYDLVRPIFSACAAAALYRRRALEDVGLFDEDFFAYGEDVDWGFRAQLLGWDSYCVPSAVAFHVGGATSVRVSGFRALLLARNLYWLVLKNFPLGVVGRHAHVMLFLITRRFIRIARQESPLTSLRGFWHALRLTPRMLRKRHRTYSRRRRDDDYMRSIIEPQGSLGSEKLALVRRLHARLQSRRQPARG